MITEKNGPRVVTPLGHGIIVGEESFYGGKLVRQLVRLDNPSRWAFGEENDVAAFFDREINDEEDHFRDATKMVLGVGCE